jgi:choline monooxygenase
MSLRSVLDAFDGSLPLTQACTIPAEWYVSPAVADAERDSVFGRNWIVIGRAEQLATPGDYVTAEVAGRPLLVVRGTDGVLRAFLNVCRHRAAPILNEPCGRVTKLRCRYHGWTYDLAGKLRGTPEFDGVANFCKEDNGLAEIAVAVWGPLVAVSVQSPSRDFAQQLAPIPERVGGGLDRLTFAMRRKYELACNWKVFVDNYLDGGYHVNTVHPGLAGLLDYSQYRTETYEWTSLQSSPLQGNDGSARPGKTAQYWYVFPNLMLNIYDGVADVNLVLPLSPNRCRVIFDFFFADEGVPAEIAFRDRSIATANEIQMEDAGICEEVQRGLASGAFTTGRFIVKRENAAYHFHQLLAQTLRSGIS